MSFSASYTSQVKNLLVRCFSLFRRALPRQGSGSEQLGQIGGKLIKHLFKTDRSCTAALLAFVHIEPAVHLNLQGVTIKMRCAMRFSDEAARIRPVARYMQALASKEFFYGHGDRTATSRAETVA